MTWTTVAGATAYHVKRGTANGGPATTSIGSPTATSFTDRSVINGTIYYYTIAAVNASGISTQSAPAAAKPQVPPVVTETDSSLTGGSFAPLAANNLILGNSGASALSITAASDGTGAASTLTDGNPRAPASSGPLGIESGSITYKFRFRPQRHRLHDHRPSLADRLGRQRAHQSAILLSQLLVGRRQLLPVEPSVNYTATAGANGTDVTLGVSGLSNVRASGFTFPNTQQNIWVAYTELAVFGQPTPVVTVKPQRIASGANYPAPASVTAVPIGCGSSAAITQVEFFSGRKKLAWPPVRPRQGSRPITCCRGSTRSPQSHRRLGVTRAFGRVNIRVTAVHPHRDGNRLGFRGGSFAPLAGNNLILGNPGTNPALNEYDTQNGWTAANLTDGDVKAPGSVGNQTGVYSIIGTNGTVTYPLGGGTNGTGYTITGIRTLTSWQGGGRVNPYFSGQLLAGRGEFLPACHGQFQRPGGVPGRGCRAGRQRPEQCQEHPLHLSKPPAE